MTAPSITTTTPANATANTFAEQAKTHAREQIKALRTQKQTRIQMKSSLQLLMGRFELEKSTLSEMIDWYARQPWLEKTTWGLLFIAVSTLIGAMINLTVVFTVLSAGLYYATHLFLSNENAIKTRRDAQLQKDIMAMEADLDESVRELNDAIKQLNDIHAMALEQSAQGAEQMEVFHAQIDAFTTHTATYVNTVQQLEQLTTSLQQEGEKITQRLFDATTTHLEAGVEISRQTSALTSITHELEATNASLLAKNAALDALNLRCHTNLSTLEDVRAGFQAQLTMLIARDCASSHETEACVDYIAEGDDAVLNAERLMQACDAEMRDVNANVRFFKPVIAASSTTPQCSSRQAM